MKKTFKTVLAMVLVLSLMMSLTLTSAFAADEGTEVDYTAYEPGVTVEADANSPTGYTATFVYEEQSLEYYANLAALEGYSAGKGSLGDSTEITKVELYSDCMLLFSYDEQTAGTKISADNAHKPDEYKAGMYAAGGDGATTYTVELTEFAEGLWGVQIPLTSGATVYNFTVYGNAEGAKQSRLDDPNNPTAWNDITGIHSLSSLVYVPYDSAKMGSGEWADRSVENPRTDGKVGTVKKVAYTGAEGGQRGLTVYLPYGYDANRAEAYNVLYLSHGASGDPLGNDLRWLNEGAAANIMDNLGGDFVVVTMSNQDLGWDQDKIWAEQELIMAYMEANYNVSDKAAGRAYAGLSMGGNTASTIYLNHYDEFDYFGIWSYANTGLLGKQTEEQIAALKADNNKIMLAAGDWDYLLAFVKGFADGLTAQGIENEFMTVPGAHDWETWQMIYAYAVENFFWKDEGEEPEVPGVDYTAYEPGVTVEADANSPTGYTATFVYEEQSLEYYANLAALEGYSAGRGGLGDSTEITKVELYSDCMMLFSYDEQAAGTRASADNAHTPDEYKAGMYPAGGDGNTTYTVELTEFAEGLWGVQIPLTSGATVYNFNVYGNAEGTKQSRLDDPNNPTAWNDITGIHSLSSLVYVPYDSAKMGSGDWADRSVENPRTDGKVGTVKKVAYTGAEGGQRGLTVYLPYGYDANRAEAYNVLYLSHGSSGDPLGNDLRWLNEGAAANIMDNLGGDFVVVTMSNQDLGWDNAKMWAEQELIMAYMEANYNVADYAAGRAYAGLSMGGNVASTFYLEHADVFDYFGIWSYANTGLLGKQTEEQIAALKADNNKIMLAAGDWDYLLAFVKGFADGLTAQGIENEFMTVPGAHDWETWQMTFAYAVENFFWKDEPVAPPAEGKFTDVAADAWYKGAVDFVVDKGIMSGVAADKFAPDTGLTRAMIVQMLWAMEGKPATEKALTFEDLEAGAWYTEAVRWAAAEGIVSGYSEKAFGPNDNVTREQLALMLMGYARIKGVALSEGAALDFVDAASVSDWAKDAMAWAVAEGILSGKTGGYLDPVGVATRAEAAQMLMKFCAVLEG